MKKTGAFSAHVGGEIDVRVTYCVVAIATLYGIWTEELAKGVVQYALDCQTYEGGFGAEPRNEAHGGYSFCAVAILFLLERLQEANLSALCHWISHRQMKMEGGYQGRTNKLVDGCYSFWQGSIPVMISQATEHKIPLLCDQEALQKYILLCGQQFEGGLRDKPTKSRDHYHTCYCLSGLSICQYGDGSSTPVVYGDPTNLLVKVHPAYNIRFDKVDKMNEYISKLAPFRHEHATIPKLD